MADIATRPGARTDNGAGSRPPRQIRRRRSLPGSRAVVGGFLVAAAAVGTFGAYTAANAGPEDTYVVLARDVFAGDRLGPDDLALVAGELPAAQRDTVVTDRDGAIGAVVTASIEEGELLTFSRVVKLDGVEGRAQLSIPVEPARANDGDLRPGELVDVIATFSSAGAAVTETIATDAVVVRALGGNESLGSSNSLVLTLSVTASELEPVANASADATITIARVSGLDRAATRAPVERGEDGDADADAVTTTSSTVAPTTTTPPTTAPEPAAPAPGDPAPAGG